jgi:hypothetical protein
VHVDVILYKLAFCTDAEEVMAVAIACPLWAVVAAAAASFMRWECLSQEGYGSCLGGLGSGLEFM